MEISAILQDTLAYGFEFVSGAVNTDEGDMSLGQGPILTVRDLGKFEASFPGRIAAMLDGQSARVISQRVIRTKRSKDSSVKYDELKILVLNAILGARAKPTLTVKVYALPDGGTTPDLAAFKAAWGIEE